MPLKGLDISGWQGDVDFDKLKADFIFIKATEGIGFTDLKFKRNQAESRRVGIPLGYYHFARPDLGNTPQAEADYFLRVIGDLRIGELLALDFEVSYSNAVKWCHDFLKHITSKLNGYKPVIYLNLSQTKSFNWKPVIDDSYGLWLAYYHETLPAVSWSVVAFHQYSNSASFVGTTGRIDANYFYGDQDALKAYGYGTLPVEPQPDYEKYKERAGYFEDALELVGLVKGSKWSPFKTKVRSMQSTIIEQEETIKVLREAIENNTTPLSLKKNEKFVYSAKDLLSELLSRFGI